MIEITNRTSGPLQLLVRSRDKVKSFDTLIIPGRGAGQNVKLIDDELYTEYIDRLEDRQMLSTRKITNK